MELFSGGMDRTLKLWNALEGSYIDTLFGHLAPITAVSALSRERAITASSDHSVRLWKVLERT